MLGKVTNVLIERETIDGEDVYELASRTGAGGCQRGQGSQFSPTDRCIGAGPQLTE